VLCLPSLARFESLLLPPVVPLSLNITGDEAAMEADGEALAPSFQKMDLTTWMQMNEEERAAVSQTQRKKFLKLEKIHKRKTDQAADAEVKAEQEAAAKLERARQVTIALDPSLPESTTVKVRDLLRHVDARVKVHGWVHHLRQDGRKLFFIDLRDGTGFAQVVLTGEMCLTYDAVTLCREACITVYGMWVKDPNERAKGSFPGYELRADYWKLVGAGSSELDTRFDHNSGPDVLMNQRHLVLRGQRASAVLKMRSIISMAFREHYQDRQYTEVTPPTIVNTNCEGGSTLFELSHFFEDRGYLTQSSQLYLETAIPAVGDCYCILPSYRAEKSSTRRHLAEFHHIEAERPNIDFNDLLDTVEDLVCDVLDRVGKKAAAVPGLLESATAGKPLPILTRPFLRMTHADAIVYCRENNIYKDAETKEHFGPSDDIPEGPERQMTDKINRPILLTRFPAVLKSFYMQKCDDDPTLTESVDLLLPGVGEVVGGSMRMWHEDELMAAYKRENMDPEPYYWFTEQRRFGSCPHGGYGLGLERFICYLLHIHHIRDACMYPRYRGRISP
jgi:asparaginyl-tRNA synthetase